MYDMYYYGIARRLIPDIPAKFGNSHLVNDSDDYRKVVDHLPKTADGYCHYGQERLDFRPYFSHIKSDAYIINLRQLPEECREWGFHFCLNNMDRGQTKPSTERSKIQVIGQILRKAVSLTETKSIFHVTTSIIRQAVEELWPTNFNCLEIGLRNLVSFLDFVNDVFGEYLPIDTVILERHRLFISDLLSGYDGKRHSPYIPDELFDGLQQGFYDILHDESVPVNDRMCAGMFLLETQTGNRISELPCYEVDCLQTIMGWDGVTDYYLKYNCIKTARADQGFIPMKTICTPVARDAVKYMLRLRKQIPGSKDNPFLYCLDSKISREGFVQDLESFRKRYKYICAKYLTDLVSRNWKGIRKLIVRGKAYSIPGIHSYRVTVATQLMKKGMDVDYIDCILGHAPMSNCLEPYVYRVVKRSNEIDNYMCI